MYASYIYIYIYIYVYNPPPKHTYTHTHTSMYVSYIYTGHLFRYILVHSS